MHVGLQIVAAPANQNGRLNHCVTLPKLRLNGAENLPPCNAAAPLCYNQQLCANRAAANRAAEHAASLRRQPLRRRQRKQTRWKFFRQRGENIRAGVRVRTTALLSCRKDSSGSLMPKTAYLRPATAINCQLSRGTDHLYTTVSFISATDPSHQAACASFLYAIDAVHFGASLDNLPEAHSMEPSPPSPRLQLARCDMKKPHLAFVAPLHLRCGSFASLISRITESDPLRLLRLCSPHAQNSHSILTLDKPRTLLVTRHTFTDAVLSCWSYTFSCCQAEAA